MSCLLIVTSTRSLTSKLWIGVSEFHEMDAVDTVVPHFHQTHTFLFPPLFCSRIGQEKDVFVEFFDAAGSVDECMRMLNEYKSQNSRVILADGTELGANTGGNLSYREISGLLSRALLGIAMCRSYNIQQNGRGALIPATHEQIIDHILTGEGNEVQRAMDDFLRGTRTIDETTARKPTLPATADPVSGST
jgi:hypothetical protein